MGNHRKGHSCFECGGRAQHAHHVVPYSKGGRRTLPLCEKCHSLVHGVDFLNHSKLISDGMRRARAEGRWAGPKVKYKFNVARVLKLRAKGVSWREIGKIIGVKWETIRTRLKRNPTRFEV